MPAHVTIVTEADIRAFADGTLTSQHTEAVLAVLATDDRAQAVFDDAVSRHQSRATGIVIASAPDKLMESDMPDEATAIDLTKTEMH